MSDKWKDPADVFRDLVGKWERGVNDVANKAMASEPFSRVMHGTSTVAVGARAGVGDAMQRYLATLNLPSRADVLSMGERLAAIEAQLARLTELVSLLAQQSGVRRPAPPPAAKPSRGRKPAAKPATDAKSHGADKARGARS